MHAEVVRKNHEYLAIALCPVIIIATSGKLFLSLVLDKSDEWEVVKLTSNAES